MLEEAWQPDQALDLLISLIDEEQEMLRVARRHEANTCWLERLSLEGSVSDVHGSDVV
jgi:hypothetical protein